MFARFRLRCLLTSFAIFTRCARDICASRDVCSLRSRCLPSAILVRFAHDIGSSSSPANLICNITSAASKYCRRSRQISRGAQTSRAKASKYTYFRTNTQILLMAKVRRCFISMRLFLEMFFSIGFKLKDKIRMQYLFYSLMLRSKQVSSLRAAFFAARQSPDNRFQLIDP